MNASDLVVSVGSVVTVSAVTLFAVRRAFSVITKIAGDLAVDVSILAGSNQSTEAHVARLVDKVTEITKATNAIQARLDESVSAVVALGKTQENVAKFAWRNEQRLGALCEQTLAAVGAQCQSFDRIEHCIAALKTKPAAKR